MIQDGVRVFETRGASGAQIFSDSNHSVLINNYPVSTFGVLGTAQHFHPLAIAVSNREDSVMCEAMINGVRRVLLKEDSTMKLAALCQMMLTLLSRHFESRFPKTVLVIFISIYQKYKK